MKKFLLTGIVSLFIAVTHCSGISIFFNPTNDACNESRGRITASVSGGVFPYTYAWSTGATTATITNLPAGTYTLTVHDNAGDSAVASAMISNSSLLNPITPFPVTVFDCVNQCRGMFQINHSDLNGTPPYTFTSNSGSIMSDVPSPGWTTVGQLCNGVNVIVNVTDALGCPGGGMASVTGTPPLNPTLAITGACNSLSNGTVTVSNFGNWFYPANMAVTTTNSTLGNIPSSPAPGYIGVTHYFALAPSDVFSVNNLSPGNYYFGISYLYTNFMNPNDGCTQYIPFTIPDLGTNCGTVQGDVFVDLNSNCVINPGDIGVPNTIMEFTPGPYYAYTNSAGHYSVNLPLGNYNLVQHPPAALAQLCPANPYPFSLTSGTPSLTVNFADTNNLPFDVSANISHGIARPGNNFNYGVQITNNSYTASGVLTVTLNYDPLLSFVSANPAPFSTSPGQVTWHLNQLTNFQSALTNVTLSVPSNPALIGDALIATVSVQAVTTETNLNNNSSLTVHLIAGSFDPNVKYAEPIGSFVPAANGLLKYTVEFQNTGNDTAFNVEVVDTLDAGLDLNTFVPGAASHPYTMELTGPGVIHFQFNNINLPDSAADEAGSHGFVSFQVHAMPNLPHATTVQNTSNIIFDLNPPVNTNTTLNTVDLTQAILASPDTICQGQSVTLNMIPTLQNTSWLWRTGTCSGALVGSGNSITVSPTATTTYFVHDSAGTIPSGSCYFKTITVLPPASGSITPGGATTFCQGDSVILSASVADNYLWSNGSTSQDITASFTGNYFVTVTDSNGCSATSAPETVTVNPLPTVNLADLPDTVCMNSGPITLTGIPAGGTFSGNGVSGNTFSPSVAGQGNHLITYSFTDSSGCSNGFSKLILVDICLGVSSLNVNIFSVSIFPNPTGDYFSVKVKSPDQSRYLFILYDLAGREIERESHLAVNEDFYFGKNLPAGFYFAEVIQGNSRKIIRLIKN